ncbi:phosphate transport system protein [Nitratiruptor sp. YY08-26]|uniref:phosphate signaling complex PhoU family protein n=1 Tax=unclassified Nitratiruptor TaxID=2624044 RepID=UPI001915C3B3|nr:MULTISPECIES: PhoU domain-containing protein [unclassified Nitratiruptor]BCD62341.1 phosphate transport system protein [Nitratiruptor sp. YY08-13]BCD66277.1 phosphate transport system protein [Nitratiruptor sp. YY08-26]
MLTTYQQRVKRLNSVVQDATKKIVAAHKVALSAFKNKDLDEFEAVIELVKTMDEEARDIDNDVVKIIALFGPEASELRELIAYIKLTNEIVRIGDYAKTYAKTMKRHIAKKIDFSKLDEYVIQLHETAIKAIEFALDIIESEDGEELYRKTMVEESKTDEIFKLFEKELLSDLCEDSKKIADYLNVLSTARKIERTADRAVEIAKLLLFAKKGGKLESF